MRDLSNDRALLSINSMTVKPWSLVELVEGCARAGISAISPWRDIVQACGVERAAKLIRAHGNDRHRLVPRRHVSRRRRGRTTRRARRQPRARSTKPPPSARSASCWSSAACRKARATSMARDARSATAWPRSCPMRDRQSVPLAIEPLHPMYAADRACVNTLAHANDLCDELGAGVGVAVDAYHVWWDPDLPRSDRARGRTHPGLSRLRLAGADHRSAARSRHDGRRRHRPARRSGPWWRTPAIAATARSEILSAENWWKRDPDEVLRVCIERHRTVV